MEADVIDSTTKRCTKCGVEKPLDAFPKDKGQRSGLRPECKACRSAYATLYYEAHKEDRLRASNEYKTSHKEEQKHAKKRYREKHRDAMIAATKRCYQAKRDLYIARNKARDEKNRARLRRYRAQWARDNPLKQRERKHRRRALERGTTTERVDYAAIWERDQGICHICHQPVDRADLHYDHVIPLSKGGSHTYENIKVSHAFCNRSKGAKLPN